jgi:metal-responsive CopG/Arc/MetJ family transcriptional regulator
MKTAISIPNDLFAAAEQVAQRLGISRSELYATALREYLDAHRFDNVTEALNEVYAEEQGRFDPLLMRLQRHSLPKDEW